MHVTTDLAHMESMLRAHLRACGPRTPGHVHEAADTPLGTLVGLALRAPLETRARLSPHAPRLHVHPGRARGCAVLACALLGMHRAPNKGRESVPPVRLG